MARLYTDTDFVASVRAGMDGAVRFRLHLAPPLLARRDPVTGRPRKREFGSWVLGVFRVLRLFRGLRGTPLDPFGYSAERRAERRLIGDYEALVRELLAGLSPPKLLQAVELAVLPDQVRGYGPIKMVAIARFYEQRDALLRCYRVV